tara:strand:+ start:510 stop:698 length:189 start_codon:yes stop_codon:yes gene_type:complete
LGYLAHSGSIDRAMLFYFLATGEKYEVEKSTGKGYHPSHEKLGLEFSSQRSCLCALRDKLFY